MKILSVTSHSATFELSGTSAYYRGSSYDILLNGKKIGTDERNVFSVFSLEPQKEYTVSAAGESVTFISDTESFLLNVKDFRALGDGLHDDTPAFSAAISCLPAGGTLYVPEGTYYVGALFLKSDMTLYLERGAVLLGKPNREDYPTMPGILESHGKQMNLGTWQGEGREGRGPASADSP